VKPIIIASMRESAGKTSMIIALANALGKKFGYIKPLGDRLLYRKKRLWDYDAALLVNLFGLSEEPENISIGFDHSKLRYMYDQERISAEIVRMANEVGKDVDLLFVEAGKDFSYGTSIWLDPFTISQAIDGKLIVVTSGDEDQVADDLIFLHRFVSLKGAKMGGIIINKIKQLQDFKTVHLKELEGVGINVFGVLPYEEGLTTLSASYVAEKLFARVIAGENGLTRSIRTVFVGAMSLSAALQHPLFNKPDKLIITSGDRSDMILGALNTEGVSCIVLTNDIVPPPNVTAKATERGIPLLLVPRDTYATAMQVNSLEPLLTAADTEKVEILTSLIKGHVDLSAIEAL